MSGVVTRFSITHCINVWVNPSCPNPGRKGKNKSNFHFNTSL